MEATGGTSVGRDAFSELVGIEYGDTGPEWASASVRVGPELLQPGGVVHGGLYATLAESVTSRATFMSVSKQGMVALGQSNQTTLLRPVATGTVDARAVRRHAGRTTWVWDVEMTDAEGRLCALTRMTIAVRPPTGQLTRESGS